MPLPILPGDYGCCQLVLIIPHPVIARTSIMLYLGGHPRVLDAANCQKFYTTSDTILPDLWKTVEPLHPPGTKRKHRLQNNCNNHSESRRSCISFHVRHAIILFGTDMPSRVIIAFACASAAPLHNRKNL